MHVIPPNIMFGGTILIRKWRHEVGGDLSVEKMAGTLRVLGILVFLSQAVYGQLNSRAFLSTSSLSRMVVSQSTGDVFLADQDTVYLLPGDLSEITSNVSRTAGQTPEGMTLSKQEDKLIVCWASAVQSGGATINDAPCVVYNSTDLLQTLQTTVTGGSIHVGAARGNPYLVSRGFNEGEGETFYVMSADNERLYHREYRIPDGARTAETRNFNGIANRRYVSGAATVNYAYFATTDTDSVPLLRVVRVCNMEPVTAETLWDSWYEIQVICGSTANSLVDFDNDLLSANFLFPEDGVDEPLLVVSVITPDLVTLPSSFCVVPLSTIDNSARNLFNYCATSDVTLQFPWENVGACDSAVSLHVCNCTMYLAMHTYIQLLSAGKYNRVWLAGGPSHPWPR